MQNKTKGWPAERRAAQAVRIRVTQPWRHATGPRTDAGKARASLNATKHGLRSARGRELTRLLNRQMRFVSAVRRAIREVKRERRASIPSSPSRLRAGQSHIKFSKSWAVKNEFSPQRHQGHKESPRRKRSSAPQANKAVAFFSPVGVEKLQKLGDSLCPWCLGGEPFFVKEKMRKHWQNSRFFYIYV